MLGHIGRASLIREGAINEADERAERPSRDAEGVAALRTSLRGPPRRSRDAARRPEADARRLAAARRDRDLPRRSQNSSLGDGEATKLSVGQVMLMSKEQLIRHVLATPDIEIYECGRAGHPRRHHRPPRARDARVPRRQRHEADRHEPALRPRLLHRQRQRVRALAAAIGRRHRRDQRHADRRPPGRRARSPTQAVRALLTLQGTMKAHQIITLMQYAGTDNTFAMRRPLRITSTSGTARARTRPTASCARPVGLAWLRAVGRMPQPGRPIGARAVVDRGRRSTRRRPSRDGRHDAARPLRRCDRPGVSARAFRFVRPSSLAARARRRALRRARARRRARVRPRPRARSPRRSARGPLRRRRRPAPRRRAEPAPEPPSSRARR